LALLLEDLRQPKGKTHAGETKINQTKRTTHSILHQAHKTNRRPRWRLPQPSKDSMTLFATTGFVKAQASLKSLQAA
jgi:hypothetical protein